MAAKRAWASCSCRRMWSLTAGSSGVSGMASSSCRSGTAGVYLRTDGVAEDEDPHQTPGDHPNDHRDEKLGRDGERRPRLAHSAQVHSGEHRHHSDGDAHPVFGYEGDRRAEIVDPGGDGHGYGQDIVHQ
jgi:hypothetical protein